MATEFFQLPKKAMGGRACNNNKNKGKILARLSKGRKNKARRRKKEKGGWEQ
jgi:hypothetical protein